MQISANVFSSSETHIQIYLSYASLSICLSVFLSVNTSERFLGGGGSVTPVNFFLCDLYDAPCRMINGRLLWGPA